MNTFILVLVIIGVVVLGWKWMDARAKAKSSPGYAKRMGIFYLLTAFTLLIGITSVLADAIFEFLGLDKPIYFELMALAAFIAFCVAAVLILRDKGGQSKSPKNDSVNVGGDVGVMVTKPKGPMHVGTGMVKKKS